MNASLDKTFYADVRRLYTNDPTAKALFDWFASRQNDARETPIERAASMAECDYSEVLRVFRELHNLGVGRFLTGRKGKKSRMEWFFSVRRLGLAAQGGTEIIEEIDPQMTEVEDAEILLDHEFQLRVDLKITLRLPNDFTEREAERLAAFVKTVPFE